MDGASFLQIKRGLEADGILNGAGNTKWYESIIKQILTNEKYIGDALLQKTYTVNTLEKKRVANNGLAPKYYVEGSHECCPYVNTNAPPQKARKMGVSWDMCVAHPSSQMAKRLHIGEL